MAGALNVTFDRDYYFNPDRRYAIDSLCNEYAAEQFPGMRLFYSESNLGQVDYWDKSQILIGGIQPNMILGMLLGAEFVPNESFDADITPGCLVGKDTGELPAPESLLDHELVRLLDEQIRRVRKDRRRRLRAVPPFFWDVSGRATIHGAMTSAQKFFGEAFLVEMLTEPGRCLEIMHWIGEAFVVLCRHFSQTADLPIAEVHVGECSCCMVNPELVERMVVPVTSEIGRQIGPVRLHSCGPSTNHLRAFSKITNLSSLDLGGDTSIRRAREIFGGELPISVAPMPHALSAGSTEPILSWAERVWQENDGGILKYVYHLEPGYSLDNVCALTDFVRSLPGSADP
jgi:hypothetical protein